MAIIADSVLYFPYIRVPKTEWFTRVLLYWDRIGSIVPSEFIYHPESLGAYMRELVAERLVQQVQPGAHVHDVPQFTSSFIQLVDHSDAISRHGHAARRRKRKSPRRVRPRTFRIHIEKFGDRLADQLQERGLARLVEYPWYEVEAVTASLFMAYLASVLGRLEDVKMDPITDRVEYLSAFSTNPRRPVRFSPSDQIRMSVLEAVLPAPAGGVSVAELAQFKSRHIELLSQFRRRIESSLIDLGSITDRELRNDRVRLLREELTDEIDVIRARMRERKWPRVVFGTFCGLFAAALPLVETLATGRLESALKALPSLAYAIHSAFEGRANQGEILRSPLAYAALAQKHFRSSS